MNESHIIGFPLNIYSPVFARRLLYINRLMNVFILNIITYTDEVWKTIPLYRGLYNIICKHTVLQNTHLQTYYTFNKDYTEIVSP